MYLIWETLLVVCLVLTHLPGNSIVMSELSRSLRVVPFDSVELRLLELVSGVILLPRTPWLSLFFSIFFFFRATILKDYSHSTTFSRWPTGLVHQIIENLRIS